jgi:hypothetical protein
MDARELREQLRQVVRAELMDQERRLAEARAAQQEPRAEAPREEPARAQEEPSEESQEAYTSGGRLVEAALVSGQWGDNQVRELRGLMRKMTPAQQQEVQLKLIQALNSQRLRVDVNGPPF